MTPNKKFFSQPNQYLSDQKNTFYEKIFQIFGEIETSLLKISQNVIKDPRDTPSKSQNETSKWKTEYEQKILEKKNDMEMLFSKIRKGWESIAGDLFSQWEGDFDNYKFQSPYVKNFVGRVYYRDFERTIEGERVKLQEWTGINYKIWNLCSDALHSQTQINVLNLNTAIHAVFNFWLFCVYIFDNEKIIDFSHKKPQFLFWVFEPKDTDTAQISQKRNKTKNVQIESILSTSSETLWDFVFSTKCKYVIPEYQRSYSWGKEECEVFLDDVFKILKIKKMQEQETPSLVSDCSHYFGCISYKRELEKENMKIKGFRIIDGQQRLITSLLIFKSIYELWKTNYSRNKTLNLNGFEKLEKFFEPPSQFELFKFSNYSTDDTVLHKILSNHTIYAHQKKSQVYKNLEIITSYIKKMQNNFIAKEGMFFSKLFSVFEQNVYLSILQFSIGENEEMTIFESLNSKGKELSTWDLVKNLLLNLIPGGDCELMSKKIHLYIKNQFSAIEKDNSKEIDKSLIQIIYAVRKNKISFSNQRELLKEFKRMFLNFCDTTDEMSLNMESFDNGLKVLQKYIVFYKMTNKIFYPEGKGKTEYVLRYFLAREIEPIVTTLDILRNANVESFRCLLIYILDTFFEYVSSEGEEAEYLQKTEGFKWCDLEKTLFFIETYYVNWKVCALDVASPTDDFADACNYIDTLFKYRDSKPFYLFPEWLYHYFFLNKELKISSPKRDEKAFESETKKKQIKKFAKVGLGSRQVFEQKIVSPLQTSDFSKACFLRMDRRFRDKAYRGLPKVKNTVEHIWPVSWIKIAFWNRKINKKNVDEIARVNSNIQKIGNWAIVPQSVNSQLKNKPFPDKLTIYKGINTETFSIFGVDEKTNKTLLSVSEEKDWNQETINLRTEQLKNILSEIYNISQFKSET